MNSRVENHPNNLLCGMGTGINSLDQLKVLDKMEKFLHQLGVFNPDGGLKNEKQPWHLGILCSIYSTRALHQELVAKGPFKYLLTARLNQDCIEIFFSRIRGTIFLCYMYNT